MNKGKITPLQSRILHHFRKKHIYNPDLESPIGRILFGGDYIGGFLLPPEGIINVLEIKGERGRNEATREFYDLVNRGYLKMKDKLAGGFYMTRKGYDTITKIGKGDSSRLEKYSSENPQYERNEKEGEEPSKLEKMTHGAIVSICMLLGTFLIIQKTLITGNLIANNISFNESLILGSLLILVGTALLFFRKIKI